MKSTDSVGVEYAPVGEKKWKLNGYMTIEAVFIIVDLLVGIVYFPIIIYVVATSLIGRDYLRCAMMAVMVVAKYSLIFVEILGCFFSKGESYKRMRVSLGYTALVLLITELMILIGWTVLLVLNKDKAMTILTDPILSYLVLGEMLGIPGLIGLCLE